MNPVATLFLALILPPIMIALLFGPFYAGCYGGLLWLYGRPLIEQALSLDYQIGAYQFLIQYAQTEKMDWLHVGLPAFLPPVAGLALGLYLFWIFIRYLREALSN